MFKFTKRDKLIKTDDFSSVFNLRKRVATTHLIFRYKPNQLDTPRLGLIIAKKNTKLAVNRNYARRVLRELFRLNQHNLPAVDLVIQVQKTFNKPDFIDIKQQFEYLIDKLYAVLKLNKEDAIIGLSLQKAAIKK